MAALMMGTAIATFAASAGLANDGQTRPRKIETGAPAHAVGAVQLAQTDARRPYDIPSQPLASALAAFGRQSGLQVSYPSGVADGLRSNAVSGTYTADEALRLMLSGTRVTARFASADAVVLEVLPAAAADAIMLEPVTVTGERVARSIMDTATSVSVLDDRAIAQRPGLTSTNDALARIPNVVETGTASLAPAVRGIDGTGPAQGGPAFFAGVRPRLNFQIDGRPASFNEVVFGDVSLWDIEQVEVFRGPQSTLQGRNAIAGAVVVKTKDPTYEPEVRARALGGNEEMRQFSGVVSGPIIDDQLAVRLAFDRRTSESFVHMTPYPGVDDPRDFESITVRGKALIEPKALDGFSTLLTLNHTDHTAPQSEEVFRPFDAHISIDPPMPVFNPRATSGIIDTTWDISDGWTFENKLALTDLRITRKALPGAGNLEIDGRELLAEPRLRFSGFDDRLNGFGGIYLFHGSQDEFIDIGDNFFEDKTTTAAVFGEGTLAVLEDVDITLGGRLEREHRRRVGGVAPMFDIDFDETYEAFLPKAGAAWHATENLTVGAVVSRGYNAGGAGITFEDPFVSYTFKPEYVWNYEAYVRQQLLGGKLNLTGNVFYADYKDIQLPFRLSPPSTATVIRNADRAVTYGAEFGATWLALPGLQIFGEFGLLKTEIRDYPNSGFEGNELPRSPAFTADFGATYQHSSGLEFGVDARYSDAYFSDIDNLPRGKVDPYWVANAQAGYTFASVRVFAFVNNLFDSGDPILLTPGATPAEDFANILRPRTFGVGLELWF